MHVRKMCLSHIIHHRHVSIVVAIIIRITYKITRNPDKLLKYEVEPLSAPLVSTVKLKFVCVCVYIHTNILTCNYVRIFLVTG